MLIRKMRLDNGWSQEHLSEITGLSVRTIQRIERGQKPSLESLKSLAAVFEVDVAMLSEKLCPSDEPAKADATPEPDKKTEHDTKAKEIPMNNQQTATHITQEEAEALEYVRDIRGFYSHLIKYVVVMAILLVIDLLTSPGKFWVQWPALGWGIGVCMHGLSAFEIGNFFGPKWEQKQINKRMRKRR